MAIEVASPGQEVNVLATRPLDIRPRSIRDPRRPVPAFSRPLSRLLSHLLSRLLSRHLSPSLTSPSLAFPRSPQVTVPEIHDALCLQAAQQRRGEGLGTEPITLIR